MRDLRVHSILEVSWPLLEFGRPLGVPNFTSSPSRPRAIACGGLALVAPELPFRAWWPWTYV
jgi:hypothetical protein